MNEKKLSHLFAAARRSPAPDSSPEFAAAVLRAVRRLPPERRPAAVSIFDQLNAWFPRVALAAAALIVLCVAVELGDTTTTPSSGDDSTAEPSQAFFNVEDI
jgi:hypothetical protein